MKTLHCADSFRGIIPAIITPCDQNSRLDENALVELAGDLLTNGSTGLYVCGLTGEAYQLTSEERKRTAELAIDVAAKRGKIIVHVGTQDTRSACELARHAAAAGADAIASIPPISRPFPEILAYYRELSCATEELPLFIYHIPVFTNWTPSLQEFASLLEIENVVGIKFTDYNLYLMRQLLALKPGLAILYGRDEQLAAALAFGACGGVGSTYNILTPLYVAIYRHASVGEWEEAFSLQRIAADIMIVFERFGVTASSEALLMAAGKIQRARRAPSQCLSESERNQLWRDLKPIVASLPHTLRPTEK